MCDELNFKQGHINHMTLSHDVSHNTVVLSFQAPFSLYRFGLKIFVRISILSYFPLGIEDNTSTLRKRY